MAEFSGGNGKQKLTPSHWNKEAPSLDYTGDMDSTPDNTCSQSSDDVDSDDSYYSTHSSPPSPSNSLSQNEQFQPSESEIKHSDSINMVSTYIAISK